jgi:hypothetical protein
MNKKVIEQQKPTIAADVTKFIDRMQISELLSRYFAAVDDKCIDMKIVKATFASDGKIVRPDGSAIVGWKDILDRQNESFARFRATHHVMTDPVIDIEGNKAKMRANLTAMHLWNFNESDPNSLTSHFAAGLVCSAVAVQTSDGWRINEMSNCNVWRTGDGLLTMARDLIPKG